MIIYRKISLATGSSSNMLAFLPLLHISLLISRSCALRFVKPQYFSGSKWGREIWETQLVQYLPEKTKNSICFFLTLSFLNNCWGCLNKLVFLMRFRNLKVKTERRGNGRRSRREKRTFVGENKTYFFVIYCLFFFFFSFILLPVFVYNFHFFYHLSVSCYRLIFFV